MLISATRSFHSLIDIFILSCPRLSDYSCSASYDLILPSRYDFIPLIPRHRCLRVLKCQTLKFALNSIAPQFRFSTNDPTTRLVERNQCRLRYVLQALSITLFPLAFESQLTGAGWSARLHPTFNYILDYTTADMSTNE